MTPQDIHSVAESIYAWAMSLAHLLGSLCLVFVLIAVPVLVVVLMAGQAIEVWAASKKPKND